MTIMFLFTVVAWCALCSVAGAVLGILAVRAMAWFWGD